MVGALDEIEAALEHVLRFGTASSDEGCRNMLCAVHEALAALARHREDVEALVEAAAHTNSLVKRGALAFIFGEAKPDESQVNEIVDRMNAALARFTETPETKEDE